MTAAELLSDLVSRPSVNPMGRDVTGPEYFEGRVTEYLQGYFQRLGVKFQTIEVHPGRCNVLARLDRPGATTTLLLDAHQDTVPVDGMTIPPFEPVIRDGRLYGRGACDVKGGMTAMLLAFERLVREQPAGRANVVVSCTCDEEQTATGATDLVKLWTDPARKGSLLEQAPDLAVVMEPTSLDIVVAHRGAIRWKLRTRGRACHSSRPHEGVNAIYKMSRLLVALEKYADWLPTVIPPHPRCGSATFSVGRIDGGISVNTVPDECTIDIDRRCIPGEDPAAAIPHVIAYLRQQVPDVDFEMLPPWVTGATLSDHNNGEWADRLMQHVEAVAGSHQKIGVPYGTNASRFALGKIPAVVFGPGSIDQAHTRDEWIELSEIDQAADILFRFCATAG